MDSIKIKDYDYEITSNGDVFSLISNKFLKKRQNGSGYDQVFLYKKKVAKVFRVHRLVAEYYLGLKDKGLEGLVVDHIDRNKTNNSVDNLRLVTQRENASWKRGASKYTGVNLNREGNWQSRIFYKGKRYNIGTYKTEEEAYNAYQKRLSELGG